VWNYSQIFIVALSALGVKQRGHHMEGVVSAYVPFRRQTSPLVPKGWKGTGHLGRTAWYWQTDLRVKPTSPVSQLQAWSDGAVGGVERRWKQRKKSC